MKNILLSSAIVATTAGFALAQTADTVPPTNDTQAPMSNEATPAVPVDPIVPPADPGISPDATTADPLTGAAAAPGASSSREGYSSALTEKVTADTLTGAPVYSSADEHIGDISELVLDTDGAISEVVVNIGGFLGIGSRSVSLPMTDLEILQENEGDDLRAYAPMSREQLEALPEYES